MRALENFKSVTYKISKVLALVAASEREMVENIEQISLRCAKIFDFEIVIHLKVTRRRENCSIDAHQCIAMTDTHNISLRLARFMQ
jgi:hypothetical protein